MRRGTSTIVAKELEADSMQYESLNDAAIWDTGLAAGNIEIWYMRPESTRDWMMGYDWLVEKGILPLSRNASIGETHRLLGSIREANLNKIFRMLQGEFWSPEGEARNLIRRLGLGHTSMSVGDVIDIRGKYIMVDRTGFKAIN